MKQKKPKAQKPKMRKTIIELKGVNTVTDKSVTEFKDKQDKKAGYVIRGGHGFYLTFFNNYSHMGWGWADDLAQAARFDLETADFVCALSEAECPRWKNDYPGVMNKEGKHFDRPGEKKVSTELPF